MKNLFRVSLLVLAIVAVACAQPGSNSSPSPVSASAVQNSQGGSGEDAVMLFGNDTVGSHFGPTSNHDSSNTARDNLIPRTVVINTGGKVTFKMGPAPVHVVAIYKPGVEPEDINTGIVKFAPPPCPGAPIINDPTNREAFLSAQRCQGGDPAPTYTFTRPGKYLVICAFLPHFNIKMYGWVVVRDR